MSDTPRTDSAAQWISGHRLIVEAPSFGGSQLVVPVEVAREMERELGRLRAKVEMLVAVVQDAKEEFVRVPYGASYEDVAAINDWHKRADEALAAGRAPHFDWTPASEPPDTSRDVLVWRRGKGWHIGRMMRAWEFWDGQQWLRCDDITHWRDVEPPK